MADECGRRVVWIRDKNLFGLRRDGRGHGVEIIHVTWIWHFNGIRAKDLGHELVNEEGVLRGDDVVAAI